MIRLIIAPGSSELSDITVSPDGSMTVATASTVSSMDWTSRPPIDILTFSETRTLTTASCHFFATPRMASR